MRRVIPFRRVRQRRAEELAFLPAALEIVETPPSPIGRAIAAVIILLFCTALAWASWGTIDIVASATGKIVPSGRTKVIQPLETGVVRAIRVDDGQTVKAGDVLIELDPTVNAAERDHLHSDLLAEQLNVARLRAALAGGDDPLADFSPPTRCRPFAREHPASTVAQPSDRAACQDRSTQPSGGAEGSRAGHDCGHHPQAGNDDSSHPAARRDPQDSDGKGAGLEAHLFRDAPAPPRAAGGAQRSEEAICAKPRRRLPQFARRAPRRWRNIDARCRTSWPSPSRRQTGLPRT